ncbi:hypothetical protein, partial [Klebsiella pneumoniae]|uniref:hypothetical protein n=1 Tax=Klebsiella pneumoniae TaxID=573 RepID=UPI0015F2E719
KIRDRCTPRINITVEPDIFYNALNLDNRSYIIRSWPNVRYLSAIEMDANAGNDMNRWRNVGIRHERIPIFIHEAVIAVYAWRINKHAYAV